LAFNGERRRIRKDLASNRSPIRLQEEAFHESTIRCSGVAVVFLATTLCVRVSTKRGRADLRRWKSIAPLPWLRAMSPARQRNLRRLHLITALANVDKAQMLIAFKSGQSKLSVDTFPT